MIYFLIMICIGFIIGGFSSNNTLCGIIGIIGTIGLTFFGITKRYIEDRNADKAERQSAYNLYFSGNNPFENSFSKKFVRYKDYSLATFIEKNKIPSELLETVVNIGEYQKSNYDKQLDTIFISETDAKTKEMFYNILETCVLDATTKNKQLSRQNIKTNKFNYNDYIFDIYSIQDYSKFAKQNWCKLFDIDLSSCERDDYPEMVDKILKILEIENISFKEFVTNFKTIKPSYYQWGDKSEISKKYRLNEALDYFYDYLKDVRLKRISYINFNKFLVKESKDNAIYLKNKPTNDEGIVGAIVNGKNPINKLKPNQIPLFIERLKLVLKKEKKSLFWLCNNISSSGCEYLNDKYSELKNPSIDIILKWFYLYYKNTIETL